MVAIEFPFPFGTGPGHGRARGPPSGIHIGHTPVKPPVKPPVKTPSTPATHTTKPATKGPGSSSSADAHHTTARSSAVPPPVTEVADPPSSTAVHTTVKPSALSTTSSTSSLTPSATLVSSKPAAVTSSTAQHAQVSASASAPADSTPGSAHGKNNAPAIAVGIIFAVIAVGAVAFLLFRRQQTRRRQARFPAWRADMRRSFIPVGALPEEVQTPISERTFVPVATAASVSKPLPPVVISPADRTSVSSAQSLIAPSTATPSYVLSPVAITPGASTLNGDGSGWPTTPASAVFSQRENCIVRRTFVPTMPDELPVVMGDSVALVQEFDDGWATCVNQRGEQGVIPLECLQRVVDHSNDAAEQDGSACRLSKRCSSLNGVAGL